MARTEPGPPVVCDAGPLIHLDELGCVDLLSDDGAARWAANRLGYRVHGTIGVLLRAIRRKQRTPSEVLHHLQAIPASSTLHLRPSLLTEIIEQVTTLVPPA